MDDPSNELPEGIDKRSFTVVKRGGFDQREVMNYLEDLEQAFRDLELWAQRTKDRLALAEIEIERSRHAEDAAVENAMSAVFDAKDRILQRAHEEASRIESRALGGEGTSGPYTPAAGDEAERLRRQAEQLLADAERRADAMIAAAELRLTDARAKSAEAERLVTDARAATGAVGGEESTWAASAQQQVITDLRRRLEVAQSRIEELEETKTADRVAIERANEEAESIIAAAQQRSAELLQQAEAAMTMPGGEAIANAEERAASIIAEAEARARQIAETVQGVKSQAETEVQNVRDEAERLQVEADRARADATAAVGRLEEAQASYRNARAEADELRAQLEHARAEIDEIRHSPEVHRAPDRPPAPPVTALDAAEGIVTNRDEPVEESVPSEAASREPEAAEPEASESAPAEPAPSEPEPSRPLPQAAPPEVDTTEPVNQIDRDALRRPPPAETWGDDGDVVDDVGDGMSASERLRRAAAEMRRQSGYEDDGASAEPRGSRYERRSAGLPRLGEQASNFGGLRSRLSGEGSGDRQRAADESDESGESSDEASDDGDQ